jgi:hypothetical protein
VLEYDIGPDQVTKKRMIKNLREFQFKNEDGNIASEISYLGKSNLDLS